MSTCSTLCLMLAPTVIVGTALFTFQNNQRIGILERQIDMLERPKLTMKRQIDMLERQNSTMQHNFDEQKEEVSRLKHRPEQKPLY